MGLAFPLGLLAGALALPLVLLYVLKLRRRQVVVAATLPWRRVLQDRRANSPWERLRRHLLLLLQLLALALLVLAFAGPFLRREATLTGDTVLVLDASASMGARASREGGRTRFDEARVRLREALLSVEGGRRAALVVAGPQPRVAVPLSGDRAALQAALDAAAPSEAPADLVAALELAATLARGSAGGEVVLVTDGALDETPALALALSRCRVLRTGDGPAENAGLTSLALRPVAGEAGRHELFAGFAATPGMPAPSMLIEAARPPDAAGDEAPDPDSWDWREVAREPAIADARGTGSLLFRVPAEPGAVLRVRLLGGDALPADDVAHVVVPDPPLRRILLSSASPFLLQRALEALPAVELSVTAGDPGAATEFDAVVIDGPLPALLPSRPVLAFGAPPAPEGSARPPILEPRVVRWESRHPALRHARFDAVRIASAHAGVVPPGGEVLVESDQGPLAVTWPAPGGRALAFWFDVTETDMPLRVTFPVVVADAIDWLTAGALQDGVTPTGRTLALSVPDAPRATLLRRGDAARVLESRAGSVLLPAQERCGLARLRPDGPGAPRLIATALLSPEETNLLPRLAERAEGAATASSATAAQRVPGRRPLWPWAVALALAVLLAEWGVHHRRRE